MIVWWYWYFLKETNYEKENPGHIIGDDLIRVLRGRGAKDTAEDQKENVTLTVSMGTNNPYGFLDDKEEPAGFVVDTWNEIGKRTGYNINFQYFDGMDAHYGAIDAGKVDVLGIQVAITDAIKDKYDFSSRYAYNVIRMVSLKDKPYESLADLAGKKICIAPVSSVSFLKDIMKKILEKKLS